MLPIWHVFLGVMSNCVDGQNIWLLLKLQPLSGLIGESLNVAIHIKEKNNAT
jgi:hypothetical protein